MVTVAVSVAFKTISNVAIPPDGIIVMGNPPIFRTAVKVNPALNVPFVIVSGLVATAPLLVIVIDFVKDSPCVILPQAMLVSEGVSVAFVTTVTVLGIVTDASVPAKAIVNNDNTRVKAIVAYNIFLCIQSPPLVKFSSSSNFITQTLRSGFHDPLIFIHISMKA